MNRKMRFEDFKNEVVAKIREFLPETFANAEVKLNVVTKNNDHQLTGLTINAGNSKVVPTIYLEQFFEEYEKGESINEVLEKIAEMRVSHEFRDNFDVGMISDYERCKERIIPRLIGQEWNQELLRNRPHKTVADLAITYCIMLGEEMDGTMTVPITNELITSWNISLDELHDTAISNMSEITPSSFASMSSVIEEMLFAEMTADERADMQSASDFADNAMYVLTNKQKMHGAAQLLNQETMNSIIEKIGNDFYILPSSIHEVLIVPATRDMSVSMLADMVREVNETQVRIEERLSDNVYVYANNTLKVAE